MEPIRFEKFTLLIDGIHKCINKIKFDTAPDLGVKSVHLFWVYKLMLHPNGLTAAEIAAVNKVDRSLVSREIETLKKNGYVKTEDNGNKRSYNSRITLTESGLALAERIRSEAMRIQEAVGANISDEELAAFYVTLEKIYGNFGALTVKDKA